MSIMSKKNRLASTSASAALRATLGAGVGVSVLGAMAAEAQTNFTALPGAEFVIDQATGNARVTYQGQMYQVNAGHYQVGADGSLSISSEAAATVAPNVGSTTVDTFGGAVDGTLGLSGDVLGSGAGTGGGLIDGVDNTTLGLGVLGVLAAGGLGFTAFQYLADYEVEFSKVDGTNVSANDSTATASITSSDKSFTVEFEDDNWFHEWTVTETHSDYSVSVDGKTATITYNGSTFSGSDELTLTVKDEQNDEDTDTIKVTVNKSTSSSSGDTTKPTVTTLSADKSSVSAGDELTLTIRLSESSTNFVADDITTSGLTLKNGGFTGSGTSYSATYLVQSGASSVSYSIAADEFTDAAGNQNEAKSGDTIDVDGSSTSGGTSDTFDYTGSNNDYDFTEHPDVTTLKLTGGSGKKLEISNLEDDLAIESLTNNLGTIEVGTSQDVELDLNLTTAETVEELDIDNSITKLTVNVTNTSASTINNLGADRDTFDGPLVVNATGAALTIDEMSAAVTEVDADDSTKDVTIGSENDLQSLTGTAFEYTGGSGSDTLYLDPTVNTLLTINLKEGAETFRAVDLAKDGSVVDAGDDTSVDTLLVESNAEADVEYNNFEKIEFDARDEDVTFDMTQMTGGFSDSKITVRAGGSKAINIANIAAGTTLEFDDGISGSDSFTGDMAAEGTLTLDFSEVDGNDKKFGAIDVSATTAPTTLDLESDDELQIASVTMAASGGNTLKIDHIGSSTETMEIVDLNGDVLKIDASDSTGEVKISTDATGLTSAGDTFEYQGSSGADVLNLTFESSTGGTTKFNIDTDTGADNVTFSAAHATEVTITTGDESDNNADTVKIASTLAATSSTATVSTGAGNDTINLAAVAQGSTTIDGGSGRDKITLGNATDTVKVFDNSGSAVKIDTNSASQEFNTDYDTISNFDEGTDSAAVDKLDLSAIGLTSSFTGATDENSSNTAERYSVDLQDDIVVTLKHSSVTDVNDLVQYFNTNVTTTGNASGAVRDLFVIAQLANGNYGIFEWTDNNANGVMDGTGSSDSDADTIVKIAEVNVADALADFNIGDFV